MPVPPLTHTQRLLWQLITAPEGAATGLAQLTPAERAVGEALVRGDDRLSGTERIDVYADMYFYRIRDCLKEDFVAVHALIGAARFHNLITDYLLVHPPSHFSLRYAGQHVPEFLQTHAVSRRWPYLPDLAAMEWAILAAFDAPDAAIITAGELAAIAPERWGELRFALSPSLQLLDLHWPAQAVWEQIERGEQAASVEPRATRLRVWRQDLRVFHRCIDAAEWSALQVMGTGGVFSEVCEAIAERSADAESAERAAHLLATWIADGLLIETTAERR